MIDLDRAREFVALHARLIDRLRLARLLDGEPGERVVTALAPYANADGGFAHALEPDVRSPSSQPIAVLTALELLHEAGVTEPVLIDASLAWLQRVTNVDGGIPFSPGTVADAPHAPWMAPVDGDPSSLHMTLAVTAAAARVAPGHPWVERAAGFCRDALGVLDAPRAHETMYALHLADALGDDEVLQRMAPSIPADGRLPVPGGIEGETLDLLSLSPTPERASRRLFAADAVAADLDRLESEQRDDGGWDIDFLKWNPSAAWEWRGRVTVDALVLLRANGRL